MKIENNKILFSGELNRFTADKILAKFKKEKKANINELDLKDVELIDSAGVALLDEIMHLLESNNPKIINASNIIQEAITTFTSLDLTENNPPKPDNFFITLGTAFYAIKDSFIRTIYLLSDISYWAFIGLFDKKGQRKGSVVHQSVLIGVDALGIIGLLSFILGLILALQSAVQLRQFGANIFVADLMGISMVTEMGPILTAIVLAGRTGSSIASEIATMKVTEEIDALKMMAINPIRYIVIPKFHAITICIPLLITASTLIGILGGLVVAVTYLDLSYISFLSRVIEVVTLKDVLVGLGKSFFFAWVIVIIGSYYGFNVKGGAEGVGKVTTQAVVASIFWVIILDAINSLIFYF